MNTADIRTLFEFNSWANARTLQSVDGLKEELLYIDMKNSFGSIHVRSFICAVRRISGCSG